MTITAHHGDSRDVLKTIPDASVDSCVTDPPYALVSIVKRFGGKAAKAAKEAPGGGAYARASRGFMGKTWDTGEVAFDPAFWREVHRVLKPGAHVVAFSGDRSYGHLQVALEAAGFEVRASILDMIDPDQAVRDFVATLNEEQTRAFIKCLEGSEFGGLLAWVYGSGFPKSHPVAKAIDKRLGVDVKAAGDGAPVEYQPVTDQARAWDGWGTALKPAFEPIIIARKPMAGTVADNVMAHGTGGLNIDACRVGKRDRPRVTDPKAAGSGIFAVHLSGGKLLPDARWPANVTHDGSPAVVQAFPETDGTVAAPATGRRPGGFGNVDADKGSGGRCGPSYDDPGGSAARFFFSAKADTADRMGTSHPTVKRLDLMQWLIRMVTPPGGTVLDPFAGSGTTGAAADPIGFNAILIEREAEYFADIQRRIAWMAGNGRLTALERARDLNTADGQAKATGADTPLFSGGV